MIEKIVGDCAIIIGINQYTNYYGNFSRLEYAENDAYEMYNFISRDMGIENIYFFTDNCPEIAEKSRAKPTYTNIYSFFLERFKDQCMDASSNLWFFFSGHGQWLNNKQYLMLSDSKYNDTNCALELNLISGILRDSGAGNIIMFIDACRSKTEAKSKGRRGLEKQKGVIIFYSCSFEQRSYEHSSIQHGLFTKSLLDGLRYHDCATVERLDMYIKKNVSELLRNLDIGDTQNPYGLPDPPSMEKFILLPDKASKQDYKESPKPIQLRSYRKISRIIFLINKYRRNNTFTISYLTVAFIMVSCAVIFSLNPTFYYDETVRILVGGKQIPWNKLKSNIPNDLNSLFTWYPGSKDGSSYQILPGNKLRIKAATGTEYWRKISEIDNLPPTVSLAIDKDFEATVKITLDSKIDFQRAYFGVRDSKKKYRQTMVYIMEKSRIESSRVDENVKTTPNNDNSEFIMQPIGLKSSKDTIYFKIRKHQSNLDLFYSENGILWNPASDTIGSVQAAYEGYEIFFSVISNDYYEPAIADFSNLLIKYLDN